VVMGPGSRPGRVRPWGRFDRTVWVRSGVGRNSV